MLKKRAPHHPETEAPQRELLHPAVGPAPQVIQGIMAVHLGVYQVLAVHCQCNAFNLVMKQNPRASPVTWHQGPHGMNRGTLNSFL